MQETDRIVRQLALETAMDAEGQARLGTRTRRAEQNTYGSATAWGKSALKGFLGRAADVIQLRLGKLSNGQAGPDHKLIADRIGNSDPEVLALLSLKICFDFLGTIKAGRKAESFVDFGKLGSAIGQAVQTELRLSWYKGMDPKLFKAVATRFHKSTGSRQKVTNFRRRFNQEGIEWKTWSPVINRKVGHWLLNCLQEASPFFKIEQVKIGEHNSVSAVYFTDEFLNEKEHVMQRAMEIATCLWPMVCEPVDWSNEAPGGYLTAGERQITMVRSLGSTLKQGALFIDMLNNLQRQAYRINRQVFEVAEHCFQNFYSVGKFKREERHEPPSRPAEGASEEVIITYKRARRHLEDLNAQLERDNWRVTETMFVARKFVDEDSFWIPWSADYRGRLYPLTTSLTPQGTDFDKSLFYFVDEGPVDEYWLAFQVATTYGLDKATMTERVEWALANTELISTIALNPLDTIQLWRDASEPWCFLAACFEYHACCIAKTKTTSGLPCGIDATCSGLQHLSAMTTDAVAASLVNVTPTEVPADGYKSVAEQAKKHLDEKFHPWLNRKVTKRTVMTTPYGVTRHKARGYIREALKEAGCPLTEPGDLSSLTKAIYDKAMPEVFGGPVEVMAWLQESASSIIKAGGQNISWTTPSGFVVNQQINHPKNRRVQTQVMGCGIRTTSVGVGWGAPNLDRHKSACAPNLVHSLDASLLHFTFSEWDKPFTVIHDCALGRSCDMEEMGKAIRLHFAEMYKGAVLEDWAAQVGVEIPEGLIKGTLDVDVVNDSLYFFC